LACAHVPQLAAAWLLGDHEARLLEPPWRQIDETPAQDAMDGRDGAVSQIAASAILWRAQETTGRATAPGRGAKPSQSSRNKIAAVDVLAIDEKALEIRDPEAKRAA